jgi:membrane protease YdiL (CAAX protease family)
MLRPREDAKQGLDNQPETNGVTGSRYTRLTVPWTLRQTIAGLLLTLVPWLVFSLGADALTLSSANTTYPTISRQVDIITGILVFVLSTLLEAIFLVAPLAIVRRQQVLGASWRERLGWLGLRRTAVGPAAITVVVGAAIGIGGSALYSLLISVLNLPLQTNSDALLQQGRAQPFTTLGLLATAALTAPICEEIFFRGFAFPGLLKGMSLIPAMLVTSVIFAVAHTDVGSLVPLFIIGVVLAWARWRSDSLWPSVIIHTINNTLAAVALIPLLFK